MTQGKVSEQLLNYVEARRKIDPEIRLIHSLAALLSQFEHIERHRVVVDPAALGIIHSVMEESILKVWGGLDDFMSVSNARRRLDSGDSDGRSDD